MLNGDFEVPLSPPWFFSGLATNSHLTNGLAHSGRQSLHLVFAPGGPKAGEWAWAGSSTTQPLENPLLWGRISLDP